MLYGRETELGWLQTSAAPLSLIVGDQGVGKSSLLGAGQEMTAESDGWVTVAPVRVDLARGASNRAVLDGLGAVVVQTSAGDAAVDRIKRLLSHALPKLADNFDSMLVGVVGGALVEAVNKLLPGIGKPLREGIKSMRATLGGVQRQILDATEPSAAIVIADLAAEIREWAGLDIALALDDCQELPDESARVLADMAARVPNGIAIRCGFQHPSAFPNPLTLLRSAHCDVAELAVGPLAEEGIAQWLSGESLDPALAADVRRVTGGYGFHINELIGQLIRGVSIAEFEESKAAHRSAQALFERLSQADQGRTRRLAQLSRPLPRSELPMVVDLDEESYWAFTRRLEEARIFVTDVDGVPWFHELRRRWIAHESMRPEERELHCLRVAESIFALIEGTHGDRWFAAFADAVQGAGAAYPDPRAAAACLVSDASLAVAAALFEQSEPGQPVVNGSLALTAARRLRPGTSDLIEGLRELVDHELVYVREEGSVSVAVPMWTTPAAVVLLGRCQMARIPVLPRRASASFEAAVRPRLAAFDIAVLGIGSLDAVAVADALYQPGAMERSFREVESLLVGATLDTEPVHYGIRFHSRDERNEAAARLRGASIDFGKHELRVQQLLVRPSSRVKTGRLTSAYHEAISGRVLWTLGSITAPDDAVPWS